MFNNSIFAKQDSDLHTYKLAIANSQNSNNNSYIYRMRIIIGILVFVVWSSMSTYWYVCKIKNICKDEKITKVEPIVKQEIVKETEPEKIQIKFDFTKLIIHFPFAQSEANISEELSDSIKIFSDKLILAEKLILIVGNTDNIGSSTSNMQLGLERAKWVKNIFISKGMNESKIEIKSFGKKKPVESNKKESGRSKNRRVEISIEN